MTVGEEAARRFYETEALRGGCSDHRAAGIAFTLLRAKPLRCSGKRGTEGEIVGVDGSKTSCVQVVVNPPRVKELPDAAG